MSKLSFGLLALLACTGGRKRAWKWQWPRWNWAKRASTHGDESSSQNSKPKEFRRAFSRRQLCSTRELRRSWYRTDTDLWTWNTHYPHWNSHSTWRDGIAKHIKTSSHQWFKVKTKLMLWRRSIRLQIFTKPSSRLSVNTMTLGWQKRTWSTRSQKRSAATCTASKFLVKIIELSI